MFDDPLIRVSAFEEIAPGLFTSCGRALYVVQHFEKNLRSIAAALDVKAACVTGVLPLADAGQVSDSYERKLKRPLYKAIFEGLLGHVPQGLKDAAKTHLFPPLDDAREARNRIAHEFLFGIEELDFASSTFRALVDSLGHDVRCVADADYSVACIIQGFNKDPAPCCRERYVDEIVQWAMAPLKEMLKEDC